MSDKLSQARAILSARIDEIDAERSRLERALAELEAHGRTSSGSPAASGRAHGARSRRGKRARPGEREAQLLSSIRRRPENRIADHARALGVRPQQLYPILRRLDSRSLIEKADGKYRAKA